MKKEIIVYGKKININSDRGLKQAFNRYGKFALFCKTTDDKEFKRCCEQLKLLEKELIKRNLDY